MNRRPQKLPVHIQTEERLGIDAKPAHIVSFRIGQQTFRLDYEADDSTDAGWMAGELKKAFRNAGVEIAHQGPLRE